MKCPFIIKKCSKCGKLLVANEINFHKQKGGKWGLRSSCRKCNNKCGRLYYDNNKEQFEEYRKIHKEEHKEYMKQYYDNNKERLLEQNKKYYEDNKDFYKEYKNQWYEDNKDRILEQQKQYYKDNKENVLEYHKKYNKENPNKIFNQHNKRRSLEENQGNGITKEQWYEMMEFFDFRCAYSGEYIGGDSKYRTIDHIVPLSKNGLNEPWNCVPMLKNLNSSKRTKDMDDWYKKQDFFDIDRLQKIYEWQEYAYNKWGDNDGKES